MKRNWKAVLILAIVFTLVFTSNAQAARRNFPVHSYLTADVYVYEYNYNAWVTIPAGTEVNVLGCAMLYDVKICKVEWGLQLYNPPPYLSYVPVRTIFWP